MMRTLQTPGERASYLDPFSGDPLHAIDLVRRENKPLNLILHLQPCAVGNEEAYKKLEGVLASYGVLSPYTPFGSVVGIEIKDIEKARQLVKEQRAGKIPHVESISVDSLAMHICDSYARTGRY